MVKERKKTRDPIHFTAIAVTKSQRCILSPESFCPPFLYYETYHPLKGTPLVVIIHSLNSGLLVVLCCVQLLVVARSVNRAEGNTFGSNKFKDYLSLGSTRAFNYVQAKETRTVLANWCLTSHSTDRHVDMRWPFPIKTPHNVYCHKMLLLFGGWAFQPVSWSFWREEGKPWPMWSCLLPVLWVENSHCRVISASLLWKGWWSLYHMNWFPATTNWPPGKLIRPQFNYHYRWMGVHQCPLLLK